MEVILADVRTEVLRCRWSCFPIVLVHDISMELLVRNLITNDLRFSITKVCNFLRITIILHATSAIWWIWLTLMLRTRLDLMYIVPSKKNLVFLPMLLRGSSFLIRVLQEQVSFWPTQEKYLITCCPGYCCNMVRIFDLTSFRNISVKLFLLPI